VAALGFEIWCGFTTAAALSPFHLGLYSNDNLIAEAKVMHRKKTILAAFHLAPQTALQMHEFRSMTLYI
jgi:hypothetical protein